MVLVRWGKSKCEATVRWLLGGVASLLLLRSGGFSVHFLHCRLFLHCCHSMTANLYILAPFLPKGAQYYLNSGNTVHLYMLGSARYFSFN